MKTNFKKFLACFLAFIMVLAMAPFANAEGEDPVTPEPEEATVTVKNVEDGATVTAYQIVKPSYDENKELTGDYEALKEAEDLVGSNFQISDANNPTSEEVTKIAHEIEKKITNEEEVGLPSKNLTKETEKNKNIVLILLKS